MITVKSINATAYYAARSGGPLVWRTFGFLSNKYVKTTDERDCFHAYFNMDGIYYKTLEPMTVAEFTRVERHDIKTEAEVLPFVRVRSGPRR